VSPPEQAAIRAALAQIGLAACGRVTLERTALAGGTIPFLGPLLEGRPSWRVEIDDLAAARADPQAGRLPHVAHLSATLAPDTGHVLLVRSPWPRGVPPIAPMPDAAEEERQLGRQRERFTGLPAEAPAISLLKALKILEVEAPVPVGATKELVAYYVLQETVRYPARPVWIVQTRGIPPFSLALDARVPDDALNHLRHVVDARTGRWLGSDSTPQPVAPLRRP
jgi:hypothetical protein